MLQIGPHHPACNRIVGLMIWVVSVILDAEELLLEVWELQVDKSWKIIKILTEKNEEQIIQPFVTQTLSPKQLLQKDW